MCTVVRLDIYFGIVALFLESGKVLRGKRLFFNVMWMNEQKIGSDVRSNDCWIRTLAVAMQTVIVGVYRYF